MLEISNASARATFANFATEDETLASWLETFERDHRKYPWLVTDGGFAKAAPHEAFGFRRCGTFSKVGFKHGAWRDVGYWELQLNDAAVPPADVLPVVAVWR
jgi:hypothetical protein